jgi:endonuclease/exonuclease/phosphatase family metal-dependent hydrolase
MGSLSNAWKQWLAENGPRLLLFARGWGKTREDAEDLVQEAVLKMWHYQQEENRGGGPPDLPLVFSTIRFAGLMLHRSEKRRRKREESILYLNDFQDVWLDPVRLRERGVDVLSLKATLAAANASMPSGAVLDPQVPGGQMLSVFGMHLDLSGLWRVRQARAIAALANAARQRHPTVLMGDLNEWRRQSGAFREFARHFSILDPGPSFHAVRPIGRLDRIMHCDQLVMRACGVHRSALAATASDHLPVWAEFALG